MILNPTMRIVAFFNNSLEEFDMEIELLKKVKTANPMILNIANSVTQSDVANGISAIGGSPLMTNYDKEIASITKMANAVCVNIGTLNQEQNKLSLELLKQAKKYSKPSVLDPVGIGAVPERLSFIKELCEKETPDIIRGNAGEIASLVDISWSAKGIDSIDEDKTDSIDEIAKNCAEKYQCVVVVTGATDTIATSDKISHISNGSNMFTVRVGTGDMLSSIIAVFAAVSDGNYYEAAKMACLVFSLSGELVMKETPNVGPSAFSSRLLDQLYTVNVEDIKRWGKYDE